MQCNADFDRMGTFARARFIKTPDLAVQGDGCTERVVGRLGEQGLYAVSEILVDEPVVRAPNRTSPAEIAIEKVEGGLRLQRLRQRHERTDVAKEIIHVPLDVIA